jgi:uncharacterized membrane protein
MNYNIVQLLMAVFSLIIGLIFKFFPPKSINSLYGYRTGLSMKNLDTWRRGNEISSDLLIKGSLLIIVVKLICMVFIPELGVFNSILFLVGFISMLVLCAVLTQNKLKKIFNAEGEKY